MGKFLKLLGWRNLNWDWASCQMFIYFFQRFHPRFAINSRKNFHSWIIHHCTNKPSSSETSLRRFTKTSWRRLAKMSPRYLQDIFKTYHQVKLFLLKRFLRDVFNMFLRRTAKTIIYREICLGHTFEKFMFTVQNFQEWTF